MGNTNIIGALTAESLLPSTEVVTTSSDATLNLSITSKRKQMFIGSGSNYICKLPPATSLQVGDTFELINASSEFILVQNSGATASSVFELVCPGCTLATTCVDNASAAGKWISRIHVPKNNRNYWSIHDEFTSSTGSGYGLGWIIAVGGNGSIPRNAPALKQFGSIRLNPGSDTTSYATMYLSDLCVRLGEGIPYHVSISPLFVSAVNSGTLTYWGELGLGDNGTNASHTDAVVIRYDGTVSANILFVCRKAGVETVVDTGINPIAQNGYDIVINSNSSRCSLYHNKVWVCTITTNIPEMPIGGAYTGANMRLVKTAGADAVAWNVDYYSIEGGSVDGR